jgi:hypothetical protein
VWFYKASPDGPTLFCVFSFDYAPHSLFISRERVNTCASLSHVYKRAQMSSVDKILACKNNKQCPRDAVQMILFTDRARRTSGHFSLFVFVGRRAARRQVNRQEAEVCVHYLEVGFLAALKMI